MLSRVDGSTGQFRRGVYQIAPMFGIVVIEFLVFVGIKAVTAVLAYISFTKDYWI